MKHLPRTFLNKQNGSALLVALVMIFLLSIMGISAMRGSNLEQRMAVNSIHASKCSQIAESSTEIALNQTSYMSQAYHAPAKTGETERQEIPITTDLKDSSAVVSSVSLQYMGEGPALGTSLGEGTSTFVGLRYEATGSADIDVANVECNVRQGAYQKAPSIPD